ncbi:uncharacterized protein LOC132306677 isoform X2 [Cornus florida]|uniref:uncharacterized protein LOC132306677 isoform X2 n=1 Tax=Cornus florida TaxID=4283 RepID=UPI00289AF2ED|nr:uncharacterized protein LOC132306677 isoform X2 [Cornus florida]
MSGEGRRTIRLYCPFLSKSVPFVAWEEQRLDLGSIARTFGVDPWTLKLNGHFVSRGVDLVASSVTWKSLLSFFSARGLSTGTADADALIVDGKPSKLRTKRLHADVENGIPSSIVHKNISINGKPQLEDTDLRKRRKLRESHSGYEDQTNQTTKCDGPRPFSLKRKQCLEDISPLKRLRENEPRSGLQGRE